MRCGRDNYKFWLSKAKCSSLKTQQPAILHSHCQLFSSSNFCRTSSNEHLLKTTAMEHQNPRTPEGGISNGPDVRDSNGKASLLLLPAELTIMVFKNLSQRKKVSLVTTCQKFSRIGLNPLYTNICIKSRVSPGVAPSYFHDKISDPRRLGTLPRSLVTYPERREMVHQLKLSY